MAAVLIKKKGKFGHTRTGRTPWEDEGRDWGDSSTSQEMSKINSKPPETRRGMNRFSPSALRRKPGLWTP